VIRSGLQLPSLFESINRISFFSSVRKAALFSPVGERRHCRPAFLSFAFLSDGGVFVGSQCRFILFSPFIPPETCVRDKVFRQMSAGPTS